MIPGCRAGWHMHSVRTHQVKIYACTTTQEFIVDYGENTNGNEACHRIETYTLNLPSSHTSGHYSVDSRIECFARHITTIPRALSLEVHSLSLFTLHTTVPDVFAGSRSSIRSISEESGGIGIRQHQNY